MSFMSFTVRSAEFVEKHWLYIDGRLMMESQPIKNKKTPDSWLTCDSVQEWRNWLSEHHMRSDGVWLKIRKAASDQAGVSLDQAVVEAICFGWIDSKMHSLDGNSYVLLFSPRKPNSIWSLNNRTRAEKLLSEGRMAPAGLQTIKDAQASGKWQSAYTSLEKPALPHDLAAALQLDPDAGKHFASWSNSDQLQVAVWIGQAKRETTRLRRIRDVINWARNGRMPPDIYRSRSHEQD
jgi:uncharacterized protein YdeI (YjbR/CyaY-like superfamily)